MNRLVPCIAALVVVTCSVAAGQPLPASNSESTVVGQVEHSGYALVGPRGRHYVFGGLAIADYADSAGTRRIVTMQLEAGRGNQDYVIYRELREGHRWALSRKAGTDGQFGVWIQLASSGPTDRPKWQSFQRARLEEPRDAGGRRSTALANNIDLAGTRCLP